MYVNPRICILASPQITPEGIQGCYLRYQSSGTPLCFSRNHTEAGRCVFPEMKLDADLVGHFSRNPLGHGQFASTENILVADSDVSQAITPAASHGFSPEITPAMAGVVSPR